MGTTARTFPARTEGPPGRTVCPENTLPPATHVMARP
jgi:hypothetical protein